MMMQTVLYTYLVLKTKPILKMLQRKCFTKCCNFTSDICFIIPILVIMWTILSLRYTLLESDPILNIKSDQILTRFSNNEKNDFSDFFQETKILPEYKTYPEDIRNAIINAYNVSYKELQKVVRYETENNYLLQFNILIHISKKKYIKTNS